MRGVALADATQLNVQGLGLRGAGSLPHMCSKFSTQSLDGSESIALV